VTCSKDGAGPRQEMVYNLKLGPVSGALRLGDHKILFGKRFQKQGWYDVDNTALQCNRMTRTKKEKKKAERHKDTKKGEKKKDKKRKKGEAEKRQQKSWLEDEDDLMSQR